MVYATLLSEEDLSRFRTKQCKRLLNGGCNFGLDRCQYSHNEFWNRRCPFYLSDSSFIRYITVMCPDVETKSDGSINSLCLRGGECPFSHSSEEILYHPLFYKTKRCENYKKGSCSTYYCPFIHGLAETRIPSKYKLPFTNGITIPPIPNVIIVDKIDASKKNSVSSSVCDKLFKTGSFYSKKSDTKSANATEKENIKENIKEKETEQKEEKEIETVTRNSISSSIKNDKQIDNTSQRKSKLSSSTFYSVESMRLSDFPKLSVASESGIKSKCKSKRGSANVSVNICGSRSGIESKRGSGSASINENTKDNNNNNNINNNNINNNNINNNNINNIRTLDMNDTYINNKENKLHYSEEHFNFKLNGVTNNAICESAVTLKNTKNNDSNNNNKKSINSCSTFDHNSSSIYSTISYNDFFTNKVSNIQFKKTSNNSFSSNTTHISNTMMEQLRKSNFYLSQSKGQSLGQGQGERQNTGQGFSDLSGLSLSTNKMFECPEKEQLKGGMKKNSSPLGSFQNLKINPNNSGCSSTMYESNFNEQGFLSDDMIFDEEEEDGEEEDNDAEEDDEKMEEFLSAKTEELKLLQSFYNFNEEIESRKVKESKKEIGEEKRTEKKYDEGKEKKDKDKENEKNTEKDAKKTNDKESRRDDEEKDDKEDGIYQLDHEKSNEINLLEVIKCLKSLYEKIMKGNLSFAPEEWDNIAQITYEIIGVVEFNRVLKLKKIANQTKDEGITSAIKNVRRNENKIEDGRTQEINYEKREHSNICANKNRSMGMENLFNYYQQMKKEMFTNTHTEHMLKTNFLQHQTHFPKEQTNITENNTLPVKDRLFLEYLNMNDDNSATINGINTNNSNTNNIATNNITTNNITTNNITTTNNNNTTNNITTNNAALKPAVDFSEMNENVEKLPTPQLTSFFSFLSE